MDASSFTAGADYGICAATMTGFCSRSTDMSIDIVASNPAIGLEADDEPGAIPGTTCSYDFLVRVLSGSPRPEMDPNDNGVPPASRSNGWRCRAIGEVSMKRDSFAIAVNASDTIGVIVCVDLERGAPEWKVMAETGIFTGSFIITLSRSGERTG
jgi:hypothetical protein